MTVLGFSLLSVYSVSLSSTYLPADRCFCYRIIIPSGGLSFSASSAILGRM